MILRAATLEDAKLLFDWRNDPLTRANSINEDEVPWDTHVAWLTGSLKLEDRKLLIASNGEPVGTVRLDIRPNETELSWTVSPGHRGKGYGKEMVCLAAAGNVGLIAHIKRQNIPSQIIAKSAGFTLVEDGDLQSWKK